MFRRLMRFTDNFFYYYRRGYGLGNSWRLAKVTL